MMREQMLTWLQEGNLTIPSFLFVHYVEMGLNEQELILLLHLQQFQKEGNSFPTFEQLSGRMSISTIECANILRKLIQRGYLEITEELTVDQVRSEAYSLVPFQQKMIDHFLSRNKVQAVATKQEEESSLYSVFEQEFGRPLSPFECETLGMWMDDHDNCQLIKAALREAVVSGKLNFRYIDRILFEWKKNGIKTVEQAKSYGEKFRSHQSRDRQPARTEMKEVPFYNWLEN